jgi:hypothetical protein
MGLALLVVAPTVLVAPSAVLATGALAVTEAPAADPPAAPSPSSLLPSFIPPTTAAPTTPTTTTSPPPSPSPVRTRAPSPIASRSPRPRTLRTSPARSAPLTHTAPSTYVPPLSTGQGVTGSGFAGGAPTDFAATDAPEQSTIDLGPKGAHRSPVVVNRAARNTKRLGHFSVTDLLLVLLLSAGAVAMAGAAGLWWTRH